MRQTPLKRRTTIRRRSESKRRRDLGYAGEVRSLVLALRDAWNAARTPCVFCGARDGAVGRVANHHVLEKAWIKDVAVDRGWTAIERERALWDLRIRLSVCERRHLDHHAFVEGRRIPREVVLKHCPDVPGLSREWGLEARFDRAYPAEAS